MLFKHLKDTPKEARGWRLWYSAWAIGALGISRGLDEGIVSGVLRQHAFKETFGFDEDSPQEATIASQLQLGCIAGSIIAFLVTDRLGRLRSSQLACLLWILGTAIWMTSAGIDGLHHGNYPQLLAGRFIAGVGVGFTPVVAPVYLAEIAPKAIRGLYVCIFSGSVYIGILLGYWVNYGTSINYGDTDPKQWTIPAMLNFIFAGLTFIASIFATESPRWLMKKGDYEGGRKALSYLRNMDADHPFIREEVEGMETQIIAEREARANTTWYKAMAKLVTDPNNRYILFLGVGIQVLGQFSGGGVFTIFAPKIFKLIGVGGNLRLLTTGVFGIVKLLSSLAAAFFLVDLLGRKFAVCLGLSIQTVCALYLALFLRFGGGVAAGVEETSSQKHAAEGAIFFFYLSGLAWAIGVNSVQYFSQTEMFDISVRALGVSLVSVIHFAGQFGSSRTLNPMLNVLGGSGTFGFYAAVSVAGSLFVFMFMPETSGMALEDVKDLFAKPWYRIGWTVNRPAYRRKVVSDDESLPKAELEYTTGDRVSEDLDDKKETR